MKHLLLFLSALTICFNCFCQNISKIDMDLQEEMQLRNSGELIKINIILKEQYDQLKLRSKSDIYRTKEEKRAFVVNELKNHAKITQQEVMSYLEFYARNANVSEITRFWIFNGMNCYATQEVIEALSNLDDVLMIGYDKLENLLPDHLNPRPAEATRELTYNITKVNAHLVWELGYTGEGVIVAVFDTGVNYNHNDLKEQMWEHPDFPKHGWNFANNNNNPMDDHYYQGSGGHGTHCAGTVAGNGASGSQTGMAPNATIMALKVLNNQGGGVPSDVVSAMEFAIEHGAHVFSMSIGWAAPSISTRLLYRNTMVNVLEAGIVASVAAGNEGFDGYGGLSSYPIPQNVRTPGDCPPPWLHPDQTVQAGLTAVICIGATYENDAAAYFTSKGPVTWQGVSPYSDYPYNPEIGLIRPDVCAPGVDIKSCFWNTNSGYQIMSGTSMATPCVAGVMALMLSKNPSLTPAEICEILETTAMPLSSTKSNTFGSGRIDAFEAVSAIEEPCQPVSDLVANVEGDKITISWIAPEINSAILHYNIFRDDELVGTSETESFIDTVAPDFDIQNYIYTVEVEYIDECISMTDSVSATVLKAPINLTALQNLGATELSWEFESNSLLFNVYKDGNPIALNISGTQYIDSVVDFDIQYCYYVKTTDEEIESASSNEACITIIGIEEYSGKSKIFPNPVSSIINIEGDKIETITIYNSIGQIVKTVQTIITNTQINVSNFATGNYMLRISYSDGSSENVKIVVK